MTAFQGAVDLGYRYLETDIRASKDGHLMVFHDATLERTTDRTGKVKLLTRAELELLDAGYRFQRDDDHVYRVRASGSRRSTSWRSHIPTPSSRST